MARIITDYLEESALRFPEKEALVDESTRLTYQELQNQAKSIASALIRQDLLKKPVAVFLNKGVSCLASFFGIAYSGNFYTMLDTAMPKERIEKILETLSPAAVISARALEGEAGNLFAGKTPILFIEDLILAPADEEAVSNRQEEIIDTDILYVLFTSGSTGVPKGVIISHRSVIDYIDWAVSTFHFDETNRWGNQAPFYFDNSVLDIYASIKTGACLFIIPRKCFVFPAALMGYLKDNQINTVFFVPTVLTMVANLGLLGRCDLSSLRNILFAGEVMPAKQLNIWRKHLPDALYVNLYGPTEITVDCTYYIVDREIADDESVPIGIPCRNSDVLLLTDKGLPAAEGEKGELCVRGSSLALGYYNNPEKTAEAFIQNPLNQAYPERIYKTGDIAHYNNRGELIYDGRLDFQIKHSGHRIELGEIETAVSAIDRISMNCCLHRMTDDKLVLFYTGKTDGEAIRRFLAGKLPDYMIPNQYVALKTMPLNPNGKIDRVSLTKKLAEQ